MKYYNRFHEIKYDMSKASLEDIENILNHYNQKPTLDDDDCTFDISPLDAACLNANYRKLTGHNHPVFIREQINVLDEIIDSNETISMDGKPTIYQRLKNNLTGEGLGITILLSLKDSYIDKFNRIRLNISASSLEDIQDILNHYDQDSVLIDGIQYHFRPSALEGAALNARYREITGHDHPKYLETQDQILDEKIESGEYVKIDGQPSTYEQLKSNDIEIGNSNHIITRFYEIMDNLPRASLEDISSLLDYFNGKPVLIDGMVYHPFNDPVVASKLNARYFELTGQNHPNFVLQASIIIDDMMKNKKVLLRANAYTHEYFASLESIKNNIESNQTKHR